MYFLEKKKLEIINAVNKILEQELVDASDIKYPPKREWGDIFLACFKLHKYSGMDIDFANNLTKELDKDGIKATPAGSYINFTIINKELLAKEVISEINNNLDYGKNDASQKKTIMIEFSNGNTHKETHIGHIRNITYGDAVSKILTANGNEVIPVSYINDFGIHVAKTLWALDKFYKNVEAGENKGFFLGQVYVRACEELKNNEEMNSEVGEVMKRIEAREGDNYSKWNETRLWTIKQLEKIYNDLNIKFQKTYYESEVVDEGKKLVDNYLSKGIFTESQGAIIADLEKYALGVLVVIRKDGTALYPVADLALAEKKFNDFNIDESIYVVDIRQGQYFKQLFRVLELAGYKKEMIHLGYDFVKLPSGMMSSRTGNVITYEELKDKMMAKTIEETKNRHTDWNEEKVKETARKISIGAIKFEMVKVGADAVITFDMEKALRFDGYTAAYIQYTYARINSIFRKADTDLDYSQIDFALLKEDKEKCIIMQLAKLPETVKKSGDNFNPSEIAKYLFELCQIVNDYYHAFPVLKEEENIKIARLAMLDAANHVIANGLGLLGIETMEEM